MVLLTQKPYLANPLWFEARALKTYRFIDFPQKHYYVVVSGISFLLGTRVYHA